ncbi:MAG: autoinducer binding domain-containing protein [Candidatus Methylacidiphilaceae bacterium]
MSGATPEVAAAESTSRLQGILQDSGGPVRADRTPAAVEVSPAHLGERWTIPSSRLRVPGMAREGEGLPRPIASPARRSGRALDLLLTKKEMGELLDLDYALASLRDPAEFPGLLARIAKIVPATSILAVVSHFDPRLQEARMATSAVHDYPEEWLHRYFRNGYVRIDPVVRRYASTFQMVAWTPVLQQPQGKQASAFVREARDFGMAHGLTCGIRDPKACQATLFSVSGKEMESELRHRSVFDHLVPHLNGAILRVSGIPANPARVETLSLRELEVLRWMKEGKSNWEVSRILRLSEATVKFHVKNILSKLQASNRSHAVALAMEHRAL